MAITFDDLPCACKEETPALKEITTKLVDAIRAEKIPAVGFVNEGKLYVEGELDQQRVDLLRYWSDAGLELGNHSYSHPDLHRVPVNEFEEDIVRGEQITRKIMSEAGKTLRFFRHPFLHTGTDLTIRDRINAFLSARDYRVAPVTIDNSEWIFARAYELSTQKGDEPARKRIGEAYIPYMQQKITFYQNQSQSLLGYPMKQILLVHANRLNSDYFPLLAKRIRQGGYRFISLDDALTDAAFKLPDRYAGSSGISWIHRWALTRGVDGEMFRGEPKVPASVMEYAGIDKE